MPHVSVIIPTHNRAALLREALQSVAAQTYRDFETIVVDDGSTEDIHRAVFELARPMPLSANGATKVGYPLGALRIIRQEQRGAAAARNRGVAESRGELIAFLDSDDLWLPEKLERYVHAMQAPDSPAIWFGPMDTIDESRRPVPGRSKPCVGGRITSELFHRSFVHVPTVVCRRDLYVAHGGFDESLRVCEDLDLWLRVSMQHPFGLIAQPLALRRVHGHRLSKSRLHENVTIKLNVLERFHRAQQGSGLLDEAAARRRLADVAYSAGRESQRAGHSGQAVSHFATARRYGMPWWRCWPRRWLARLMHAVGGRNNAGRQDVK